MRERSAGGVAPIQPSPASGGRLGATPPHLGEQRGDVAVEDLHCGLEFYEPNRCRAIGEDGPPRIFPASAVLPLTGPGPVKGLALSVARGPGSVGLRGKRSAA